MGKPFIRKPQRLNKISDQFSTTSIRRHTITNYTVLSTFTAAEIIFVWYSRVRSIFIGRKSTGEEGILLKIWIVYTRDINSKFLNRFQPLHSKIIQEYFQLLFHTRQWLNYELIHLWSISINVIKSSKQTSHLFYCQLSQLHFTQFYRFFLQNGKHNEVV